MKLEVAAAALIGTPQNKFMAGTLNTPPPTPSNPEILPAKKERPNPAHNRCTPYETGFSVRGSTYWAPSSPMPGGLFGSADGSLLEPASSPPRHHMSNPVA